MLKTSQKLLQFGLSSLAAVTLGSIYCDRSYSATLSGFTGGYDFNNFSLSYTGANSAGIAPEDGFVITTGAPTGTVILSGGNNGSFDPGTTDWTITITNPSSQYGSVSFDWSYASEDVAGFDRGGFLINNGFSFLSDTNGDFSLVPVTFTVDNTFTSIGFRVATDDNLSVPGVLTISNFNFVPVPFEFSPALGLASLGAFAVYKSWRKSSKK